ncbi:MAG: hypothetical protein ACKV0T_16025 [Planctomycetales bacterium]
MNDIYASLAFGILLVAIGAGLIRWHVVTWRALRSEPVLQPRELRYYRAQFRRRMQVSVLLIVLGIMIPLGDALMMQRRLPGVVAGYWIAVLLLTFWIVVLAALDWLSGQAHRRSLRNSLADIARQRRELEAEASRLREQHRQGNGNGRMFGELDEPDLN